MALLLVIAGPLQAQQSLTPEEQNQIVEQVNQAEVEANRAAGQGDFAKAADLTRKALKLHQKLVGTADKALEVHWRAIIEAGLDQGVRTHCTQLRVLTVLTPS